MSHNSYIRPSGLWGTNTPVYHGEMQAFDVSQFKAVNGDDGGTWAPTSPIVILGSGATLKMVGANSVGSGGSFTVNGGASFTLDVSSTASVAGTSTFQSTSLTNWASGSNIHWQNGSNVFADAGSEFHMSGFMVLNAGSGFLEVDCTSVFSGSVTLTNTASLDVQCSSTFTGITNSGLVSTGGLTVTGTTSLNGVSINGAGSNISADISTSGSAGRFVGRTVKNVLSAAGAAGQTASPISYQMYYFPSAAAGSTIQISDTGAVNGDQLVFVTDDTTNPVIVKNPGGATISAVYHSSGAFRRIECTRISGTWLLTDYTLT